MKKAIAQYLKGAKVPYREMSWESKGHTKEDRLYVLIQTAQTLNKTSKNLRDYGYKSLNLSVEEYQDKQYILMGRIDNIERRIINVLKQESGKDVHLPKEPETLADVLDITKKKS